MTVNTRFELDTAAINRRIKGPSGVMAKSLLRYGLRVQTAAKKKCPVNHGRLRASIGLRLVLEQITIRVEIGTDVEYAPYVHGGTGLYGPHNMEIFPTHGKLLVFKPKGSSEYIFVQKVRGQRPKPFLTDALKEVFH